MCVQETGRHGGRGWHWSTAVFTVYFAHFRRENTNLQDLQDIMLDEGRRPKALLQGGLTFAQCLESTS